MAHARAVLPLVAVPLLVIVLACAVGHVSATASYVFGFCQAPHGALFEGGWNNADTPSTGCHRGMFGVPGGDGSVFDSSSVQCEIPDASPTTGDSPTCTCLGVPQCKGGEECGFDCSCGLADVTSASAVNTYFSGRAGVEWSGALYFEGGTASVTCTMVIPPGQYVHGYTLTLQGVDKTFECEKAATKAASNWTCHVDPLLSATPLTNGSTFTQVFTVKNGAGGILAPSLVLAVVMYVSSAFVSWRQLHL